MSNIRGVHVLAEFPCPKCGGPSVHLAVATVDPTGRLYDPTEHAGGNHQCTWGPGILVGRLARPPVVFFRA